LLSARLRLAGVRWFKIGLERGTLAACDTFAALDL